MFVYVSMSVVVCVLKQREIPAGGKMHKNDTEYSYTQDTAHRKGIGAAIHITYSDCAISKT